MRGEAFDIVVAISTCTIAVIVMAAGFEGYLYGIGKIGWPTRGLLFVGAAGFLYPDPTAYAIAGVAVVVSYGGQLLSVRAHGRA